MGTPLDLTPFGVSLQVGLWVTGLLLLLGFPLAWWFTFSRRRGLAWLEALVSLPLVLSPTVLGFYLLLVLAPQGPLGSLVERLTGIRLAFSLPGVILGELVSGLPFMLAGLRSGLAGVPLSLLEASATLGKGRLETVFRVVLPNMKTGLLSGILMTFAHAVGEFGVVLMIGGSVPGATKVVSIALYERVESLDFAAAQAYALALVALAYPALVWLSSRQRRGRRGQP